MAKAVLAAIADAGFEITPKRPRLAGFQFGGRGGQAAPNIGSSVAARQFERSAQRPYPFAHSRETAANHGIRGHADAIVGNLHQNLAVQDGRRQPHLARLGVAQNVGYSLLQHAIDRLRDHAIDGLERGVDFEYHIDRRGLRPDAPQAAF